MDHDNADFDELIRRGMDASQARRSQEALALFAQASRRQAASEMPHWLSAAEHAALGQVDEAEAAFAQALLLAPGFSLARYQLGLLQFSAGRTALALLTWQPLLDLPDAQALPHFVRGFAALALDDPLLAQTNFRAGLGCEGVPPPVAADIAQVLERLQAPQRQAPPEAGTGHVLLAAYSRALH